MMKKLKDKSSLFQLFNMLDCGEYKKSVILQNLKITPATFYKNVQKLKAAGFDIYKKNSIYSIKRYKNILDLDNNEKSAIAYMLSLALTFLPQYKYKHFENFIKKFLMLSKKTDYLEVFKKFRLIEKYSLIEEYEEKIDLLEYFIINKQKIKITLRSGKMLIIKPLSFEWKQDRAILYYVNINTNSQEKLNVASIAKIEENYQQEYINQQEEIIFELYGTLAKRYLLKEKERIIKSTKNSLIVASGTEDKEKLFKRLLRYDTLCKILFPKHEISAFHKLIDRAIINIESMG